MISLFLIPLMRSPLKAVRRVLSVRHILLGAVALPLSLVTSIPGWAVVTWALVLICGQAFSAVGVAREQRPAPRRHLMAAGWAWLATLGMLLWTGLLTATSGLGVLLIGAVLFVYPSIEVGLGLAAAHTARTTRPAKSGSRQRRASTGRPRPATEPQTPPADAAGDQPPQVHVYVVGQPQ